MGGPFEGGCEQSELAARGLVLAVREAEARSTEIARILSSRRLLRSAAADARVREARLALLEQLSFADYPRPSLLAAARQLEAVTIRRRSAQALRRLGTLVVATAAFLLVAVVMVSTRALHGLVDRPPLLALVLLALTGSVLVARSRRLFSVRSSSGRDRSAPQLDDALALVSDLCRR